jgi:hypothetical protein
MNSASEFNPARFEKSRPRHQHQQSFDVVCACVKIEYFMNMQPKSSMHVSSPSRRSLHESGHEYNQRTVPPPADAPLEENNVAHTPVSHQRSGSAPHVVAQPPEEHGVYVEFVCSPTTKGAAGTTDTVFMHPQPMQTIEQLLARHAADRRLATSQLQVFLRNSSTPLPLHSPSMFLIGQKIYVMHGE